jgi:class 3 adenylate cyclase
MSSPRQKVAPAEGGAHLLEPHRQDIAVLFCDLRGFTRFTNGVEPHIVLSVLAQYYGAVGTVLEAHEATIGRYDGDGVLAYLGDPIPRNDTAQAGVALALAIAQAVEVLVDDWRAAGHDLGHGIGLAYGSATLGVIGFAGRYDYAPLGAVVNLAARLCSDARPGEIVVDESVRVAAGDAVSLEHRDVVALKGFDKVTTYSVRR